MIMILKVHMMMFVKKFNIKLSNIYERCIQLFKFSFFKYKILILKLIPSCHMATYSKFLKNYQPLMGYPW